MEFGNSLFLISVSIVLVLLFIAMIATLPPRTRKSKYSGIPRDTSPTIFEVKLKKEQRTKQ